MINSNRAFLMLTDDQDGVGNMRITIKDLCENAKDYECIHALNDIIDDVLDLKVGQSIYFQPNRDDSMSKGILRRIS